MMKPSGPEGAAKSIICVVDDDTEVNRAPCSLIKGRGDDFLSFADADDFLRWFHSRNDRCDLIISDINMPGRSGYDLCRAVRAADRAERIPVILITGSDPSNEKATGLEAGADDFIQKPFQKRDLFAKVDSLLAIHAADLAKTKTLDRLTGLVSPAVARLLTSGNSENLLRPHRAEVSVLFIDLRKFTAFAKHVEPEEVLDVLGRYYRLVGGVALRRKGTLGHLAGDGIMVFFNDPEPLENHQEAAVQAALDMRAALAAERTVWNDRGYGIDFGIGLDQGYATIGRIGFDHFWHYSVIGSVTNLASRLCQAAAGGQILVTQRFVGKLGADRCRVEPLGAREIKGIDQALPLFNIVGLS